MLRYVLHFLVLLPLCSSSVTVPTLQLFQNTLRRWGIKPFSKQDRIERWNRFLKAKDAVEQTTTDIILESLNMFTVLNDEEFETRAAPIFRGANITELFHHISSNGGRKIPSRRKRSLPETFDFWEKEVGLSTPRDQAACGSCWSFPNVGTMEALNKHLTGDDTEFSEQYFVDCTFTYSGCAGGTANEGYKLTLMRQYMLSAADWPYTADYQPCPFSDDIASFKKNALDKIWIQDFVPLGKNEASVIEGLLISPVAFGAYISDNIFGYSGGTYSDSLCATQATPHAMLLVGYNEKTLRVKASYGTIFGDYGYINYKRDGNLDSCRFFDTAFSLTATYRRDVEYEYCNGGKVGSYTECKNSCRAMNTATKSGWDLATIPTRYHNELIVQKLAADYPGVKRNDSFNYLWIGLVDEEKDQSYEWLDSFTPVNYVNISGEDLDNKYGMINKNTGRWITKNSLTYPARGLCSRAINCWNIIKAVTDGTVTFSKAGLTEGTVATVKCENGLLVGANKLKCVGGQWDKSLPTCSIGGHCTYKGEGGTRAIISPDKLDFKHGEELTVACLDDKTTKHTCSDGVFIPDITKCPDTISSSVVSELSTVVAVVSGLFIMTVI
ncbi:hypothetical protein ACHWQZ_G007711 [Mnemiopsis leidyi]